MRSFSPVAVACSSSGSSTGLSKQASSLIPVGRQHNLAGDMRFSIRALMVANNYLESDVSELMKAVSHANSVEPF